jgi:hypothetical protein
LLPWARFITSRAQTFSNSIFPEMKILQISSASSFGGGERHLVDLTNALVSREHDVFVALGPSSLVREPISSVDSSSTIELHLRERTTTGTPESAV